MKVAKNSSGHNGKIAMLVNGLIMVCSITMGVVFLSLTPKNQNINDFCSKSANVSEWDCQSTLTINSNIAYSTNMTDAVVCFSVAVIALLFLVNRIDKRS